MNEKQVHKFLNRYLEATGCTILEKSPAHFTVKLSPEADRELTNRPYYWSFVDRVGAEPETMTFLFVTDKQRYDDYIAGNTGTARNGERTARGAAQAAGGAVRPSTPGAEQTASGAVQAPVAGEAQAADGAAQAQATGAEEAAGDTAQPAAAGAPAAAASAVDAALARSFGFVNSSIAAPARIPREDLYFGARKLDQLFGAARAKGSFVHLFQEPDRKQGNPFASTPYTAWLGINLRVEFACDRKREEIVSFGVSLATGFCAEGFHERLLACKLTPRLPANIHVTKNGISFGKALAIVEHTLERKLRAYDYRWAEDAAARLAEELARIEAYYKPLLEHATDENRAAIEEQFIQRQSEIRWQYEPRVTASAINCGIFHLEGID